jgi:hypothetical protein
MHAEVLSIDLRTQIGPILMGPACHRVAMSRQRFKKIFSTDGKRPSQLHNVFQAYVPFTPFHAADVIAMEVRPFGQFLLRVAALFPQSAYRHSKQRFGRSLGHIPMV